jgi:hypothetical protein
MSERETLELAIVLKPFNLFISFLGKEIKFEVKRICAWPV